MTSLFRRYVLGLLCSLPVCLSAEEPAPKQLIVKLSRATTRITAPLDKQGFVDYVAAVDQFAAKGVNEKNNFEVVVRQVLGPIYSGKKRVLYYQKLGIQPPDPNGDFYLNYPGFVGQRKLSNKKQQELYEEQDRLMDRPWSVKEFPNAARWLTAMNGHLDKLSEGSKRPKFYTPYDVDSEEDKASNEYPRMISVLLESAQQQREIARGLKIRAMHRIESGDLDGAWNDFQTIRRQARHVGQGMCLIESLVGYALEAIATSGEQRILQSDKLTEDQAKRYLADLQKLPPMIPLAEKIDVGERYMGLEAMQWLARNCTTRRNGQNVFDLFKSQRMLKLFNDLTDASDALPLPGRLGYVSAQNEDKKEEKNLALLTVDWTPGFTLINRYYDRLVAAASEKNPATRTKLYQEMNTDLKKIGTKFKNGTIAADFFKPEKRDQAIGLALGELLVTLLLPATAQAQEAEFRTDARLQLMQLGVAAAIFQRQQGRYPKSLEELAPKYFKQIPHEPASGKAFVYRATQEGVLIYGLGKNGKDDQGEATWDSEAAPREADDIAIRVGKISSGK